MSRRFHKVLVANRGEIACRILRTARSEGYATVAVYSDADADALHVTVADEAIDIGGAPAGESYLNTAALIAAAKGSGADAIHPGYGFLSENADFAAACADADLLFIGPPPSVIAAMGNKAEAKGLMADAGVPCVPGYDGADQDDATLLAEMERVGFPVLLKAVAGGGGRGMRVVHQPSEAPSALADARTEAQSAFGCGDLLIERFLEKVRHVEVQILADAHGQCIHLGERDCSVQRRYQKVIEESPSPAVDEALRAEMGAVAVRAAQATGYVNAGTVEFLLDQEGHFYFLEMNTRLQVEHPVTELVTGLDLVALQLAIAQGDPLPLAQEDVMLTGHAMELRLYAEDPATDFAPQTGKILHWQLPEGADIRIDHGLRNGYTITPYYDAMLAKIVAWGTTREESRARILHALRHTTLLGIPTNQAWLESLLQHEQFAAGSHGNDFVANLGAPVESLDTDPLTLLVAAAVLIERDAASVPPSQKGWSSTGNSTVPLKLWHDNAHTWLHVSVSGSTYALTQEDRAYTIEVITMTDDAITFTHEGHRLSAPYALDDSNVYLSVQQQVAHLRDDTYAPPEEVIPGGDGILKAPMVGQVVELHVAVGDTVAAGDVLVVLEAMKMVNALVAPFAGTVTSLRVAKGDRVDPGQVVLELDPLEREDTP